MVVGEADNEVADVQNEEVEVEETEEVEVEVTEASGKPKFWSWGTGRRKASIVRVRVRAGNGQVVVNKKPLEDYFRVERHRGKATLPLKTAKLEGKVDVYANCCGGGITGQSDAMLMGLARALVDYDPSVEPAMRQAGHLTRDARRVERKKYGQAGARRRFQYSKR
jgi:small subunit ribosomal protein S9